MEALLYFIRDGLSGTHYFIYAFICFILLFAIIGYLFKQKYAKVEFKLATSQPATPQLSKKELKKAAKEAKKKGKGQVATPVAAPVQAVQQTVVQPQTQVVRQQPVQQVQQIQQVQQPASAVPPTPVKLTQAQTIQSPQTVVQQTVVQTPVQNVAPATGLQQPTTLPNLNQAVAAPQVQTPQASATVPEVIS